MYLYFDKNGVLKEIVNDKALRQGSQDYNSIFIYWPDIETETLNSIWFRFVTQARRYSQVQLTPLSLTESMKIPYNPKRDLKFFEYGKDYKFYEIKTTFNYQGEDKNVLSDYGTTSLSIYVTDANDERRALGKVVFNVEESTEGDGEIQEDEYITLAQWNYLLKILGTAADDEFIVYQFRGSVDTYSNLPSTDLEVGNTYNVLDTGKNYAWDGEEWDEVAGIISTAGFVTIGGTQTISGNKKFTGDDEFTQSLKVNNINPGESDLILDKTGGKFRPKTDSTIYKSDLGTEDYKWGDIWFTGKLKDGIREFGLEDIPVNSELVHKAGSETITGTKTFSSIIYSDVADIALIGKNGYIGIRAMSGDSIEGQVNIYTDGTNKAAHMFAKGSDNYYYGIKASKKGIEWEHPNGSGTQVEEDLSKYPGIVNTTDNQEIGGNKTFTGTFKVGGAEFNPTVDDTTSLGSATLRWAGLRLSKGINMNGWTLECGLNQNNQLDGSFNIKDNNENLVLKILQNGLGEGTISYNNISPSADGAKNLGSYGNPWGNYRWGNLYLSGNLSDGSHSVTIEKIYRFVNKHVISCSGFSGGSTLYFEYIGDSTQSLNNVTGTWNSTGGYIEITGTPIDITKEMKFIGTYAPVGHPVFTVYLSYSGSDVRFYIRSLTGDIPSLTDGTTFTFTDTITN